MRNRRAAVVGDIYDGTARAEPDWVRRLMGHNMRPAPRSGTSIS